MIGECAPAQFRRWSYDGYQYEKQFELLADAVQFADSCDFAVVLPSGDPIYPYVVEFISRDEVQA